jgi:hypothetical protein
MGAFLVLKELARFDSEAGLRTGVRAGLRRHFSSRVIEGVDIAAPVSADRLTQQLENIGSALAAAAREGKKGEEVGMGGNGVIADFAEEVTVGVDSADKSTCREHLSAELGVGERGAGWERNVVYYK